MHQFRLVSLFLLLSVMHYSPVAAQATRISSGGTLPTACSVGNIYVKTGTGVGFYACLATNTWSGPYDIGTGIGTVTHTAGALVANQLVIGNALADLKTLGSLGTTTTVLHGNAGGPPTFGAVSLTADVSGVLPVANFSTGTPTGAKFVRDDGVLAIPPGTGGSGNVNASGTLTANAIVIGAGSTDVVVTTTGTGILTALGINVGSAGAPVTFNGALGTPSSGTLTSAIVGSVTAYLQYQDQKTQNTVGGAFSSGAWRTRVLNTEVSDVGGYGTLASNQITLAAGTYLIRASAPAYYVNRNQLRLQNVTDTTTLLVGQSNFSAAVGADMSETMALLSGVFTIAASKALELQHQCSTTNGTDGFGVTANFTTEVYAVVELWKIG